MVSAVDRVIVAGQGGTVSYAELLQAGHMRAIIVLLIRDRLPPLLFSPA
jgi:hypothetical protein